MTRLEGRRILVVDADRRLGRAAAEAFVREGAHVATAARTPGAGQDAADSLGAALAVALDPLDPESCERAVQTVVESLGGLDVLCSSASEPPRERRLLHETSEQAWDLMFAECVTATALPARSALRAMREGGGGVLILISSSAALVGVPNLSAYAAAKGALLNFTRGLAYDGASANVRANCLCLGQNYEPLLPDAAHAAGWGCETRPEEMAPVLVFLASDESRHVTGQIMAADAGMTAWR